MENPLEFRRRNFGLSNVFSNFYKEGLFCDLRLVSGFEPDRILRGHRIVLAAFSGVLKNKFLSSPDPESVIKIKYVEYDSLKRVFDLIYDGSVVVENAEESEDLCFALRSLGIRLGDRIDDIVYGETSTALPPTPASSFSFRGSGPESTSVALTESAGAPPQLVASMASSARLFSTERQPVDVKFGSEVTSSSSSVPNDNGGSLRGPTISDINVELASKKPRIHFNGCGGSDGGGNGRSSNSISALNFQLSDQILQQGECWARIYALQHLIRLQEIARNLCRFGLDRIYVRESNRTSAFLVFSSKAKFLEARTIVETTHNWRITLLQEKPSDVADLTAYSIHNGAPQRIESGTPEMKQCILEISLGSGSPPPESRFVRNLLRNHSIPFKLESLTVGNQSTIVHLLSRDDLNRAISTFNEQRRGSETLYAREFTG